MPLPVMEEINELVAGRTPPPPSPALFSERRPLATITPVLHARPSVEAKTIQKRPMQVAWIRRRISDFKKTDTGHNTFTQIDALSDMWRKKFTRTDFCEAITALHEAVIADFKLVDENAKKRHKKELEEADARREVAEARCAEAQRIAAACQVRITQLEAQLQIQDALPELNMSMLSVEPLINVTAEPYNELEESALEANLLTQEELLDLLVSDDD